MSRRRDKLQRGENKKDRKIGFFSPFSGLFIFQNHKKPFHHREHREHRVKTLTSNIERPTSNFEQKTKYSKMLLQMSYQ
jgi:hypothetical protein